MIQNLWNTDTLCCLVPPLLHHESPDTDTLVLAHAARLQSQPLCQRRKDNFHAPDGPFYISKGAFRVER